MRHLLMGLGLLLCLAGCKRDAGAFANGSPTSQPQGLPVVTMMLNGRSFILEVAADEPTQQQGLMYRESMSADRGMIFVFPDETPRSFWMKNTRIPLDIVYLTRDGGVVSVSTMKPFDLTSVPSGGPAQYAIELNAGVAAAVGIKPGDAVALPPSLHH